jgi:uncharacterized protein (TIGR00661 family)
LYCVLDWGLGHASRSVPIIRSLLGQYKEIILASDGNSSKLLQKEFPKLETIALPEYDITYKHESIALNLLSQSFKLLRVIKKENKRVSDIVKNKQITHIISDNRFGCYHDTCENILISHQIRLLHSNRFIQASATRLNKKLISKFDQCWVPDYETTPNLSGLMSHNISLDIPVKYIGPQSRFAEIPTNSEYKFTVLAILSGPEPQRTYLENKVSNCLLNTEGRHIIVRGIESEEHQENNIKFLGIQDVKELTSLIQQSKYLISRSGYSSLMDYNAMKRKAILIPTPGQTEQEYLAKEQIEYGHHLVLNQDNLDLSRIITV